MSGTVFTEGSSAILTEDSFDSEQRRYARQLHDLEAEILVRQWPRTRRLKARIGNVSLNGIGATVTDSRARLKNDKPVTVHWRIPPEITDASGAASKMTGTVVRNGDGNTVGIRFDRLISEQTDIEQSRGKKTVAVIGITVLSVLVLYLKSRNIVSFWYSPLIQLYSLAVAAFVLSRIGLSFVYSPPKDKGVLKKVTMIISVKNEEDHIADTVRQCLGFNYPKHLMEMIVVDDGSTDDTWKELLKLQAEYPWLKLFQFKKNRGKRHGMALGAEKATGEILVFMDSDVIVDPEGLYRIVQPFADPAVGAVAGHTHVIIDDHSIISKMESVRYFVSQRVMKAAEAVFGAVTCCPGPFSAYRRDAVMAVLNAWLNQRFLGAAATFGDDRSLTNYILRNYKVVYHSGARCSTYVPEKWSTFVRQQLRWKKSWIRETTIAARFMFRENVIAAVSYYLGVIISIVSPLVMLRAFLYAPLVLSTHTYLHYIGGLFLLFLLLGLIYFYHTRSRYWYYGLLFAIVYSWFFSVQTYYAMVTVRKNHWGTR